MREFSEQELKSEYWLPLKGLEKYCSVSSLGRFKRKPRFIITKKGWKMHIKELILTLGYYSNGYEQFSLSVQGKRYTGIAHRLIAETFIPNPYNLPQINHKNGIRDDNKISNLEWCTVSDNVKHSFQKLNRKKVNRKGENNHNSVLTEKDVLEIRALYKEGLGNYEIAKMYKMNPPAIWKIIHKHSWKHI